LYQADLLVTLRPDMTSDGFRARILSADNAIPSNIKEHSSRLHSGLRLGETRTCLDLEVMRFHTTQGVAVVQLSHLRDEIELSSIHFTADSLSTQIDTCDWCGLSFPNLLCCDGCKKVLGRRVCYCSRECQKAAWPEHKRTAGHAGEACRPQSEIVDVRCAVVPVQLVPSGVGNGSVTAPFLFTRA
jgi:hypothetical protein